ncbi:MAG: hypothetical protein H7Y27_04570 [Gemmatimonadaceae bacterium]|nr:hypothetical protein [Chitinophagaceae bacterium]
MISIIRKHDITVLGWKFVGCFATLSRNDSPKTYLPEKIFLTFALMKVFALFMALLVFALNCMPCTDGGFAGGTENAAHESVSQQPVGDADHDDDCSPFCHCSCCAGFSINHFLPSISSPHGVADSQLLSSIHSGVTDISLPIWQPPQLAI